jgi:hypothetical protein
LTTSSFAEAQAFITRYRSRYKADPDSFSPLAYGAVGMLRDAITRAGSTGPEKIRAALAPIKDPPRASGSITWTSNAAPRRSPTSSPAAKIATASSRPSDHETDVVSPFKPTAGRQLVPGLRPAIGPTVGQPADDKICRMTVVLHDSLGD